MRFVPVPHFAYFKVLNGITSKLLVLKQGKKNLRLERETPTSADTAASA